MKSRFMKITAVRYLWLLWNDAMKVDIFKDAYAMAYVTLFSFIPSLAACFALISLFMPLFGENTEMLRNAEGFILKNLATGSGEQVVQYLESFLSNTDFKKIGVTGLVSTLVTLTLLLQQIEESLNRIFEVKEKRTMVQRFLYFWTILTLGTFSLAISVGTLSSFAWSSRYLDLTISQKIVRDVLYMGGMFFLFFVIYKFGPNRHIKFKSALIGAALSATMLIQAIRFFSLYISNFTRYQAIYGALAALPIFLLWLYIMWLITLIGALVVKRAMDGMPRGNFDVKMFNRQVKTDYFEVILPFVALLKTYEYYERGDACTPDLLGKDLFVTATVARKACSDLLAADLVLCRHNEEKKNGAEEFFPRFPSHKITFAEVKKKILGDADTWLGAVVQDHSSSDSYYHNALEAYLLASPTPLSVLTKASNTTDGKGEAAKGFSPA
ncbi:MAG: YihY family inner membrane protein [Proteobacteria bacterium]|nr:MAG: YihY family inner membrane protein [Pseudomonadota bacterium]